LIIEVQIKNNYDKPEGSSAAASFGLVDVKAISALFALAQQQDTLYNNRRQI